MRSLELAGHNRNATPRGQFLCKNTTVIPRSLFPFCLALAGCAPALPDLPKREVLPDGTYVAELHELSCVGADGAVEKSGTAAVAAGSSGELRIALTMPAAAECVLTATTGKSAVGYDIAVAPECSDLGLTETARSPRLEVRGGTRVWYIDFYMSRRPSLRDCEGHRTLELR